MLSMFHPLKPSITRAASRARSTLGEFREASIEVSSDVGAASGASSIAPRELDCGRQSLERGVHDGAHLQSDAIRRQREVILRLPSTLAEAPGMAYKMS